MSELSITLGITPYNPTFREIGRTELIDGKPKREPKPATIRRKNNKANSGCLRISQQQSNKLRIAVIKTLAVGGKYTAKTMAEKVGFAQSAVRRNLKALAEEGFADCETVLNPRYDTTWYWMAE